MVRSNSYPRDSVAYLAKTLRYSDQVCDFILECDQSALRYMITRPRVSKGSFFVEVYIPDNEAALRAVAALLGFVESAGFAMGGYSTGSIAGTIYILGNGSPDNDVWSRTKDQPL